MGLFRLQSMENYRSRTIIQVFSSYYKNINWQSFVFFFLTSVLFKVPTL